MSGLRHITSPAINLMANLKYKTKISLVFGILLVPLSVSLFFYYLYLLIALRYLNLNAMACKATVLYSITF